MGGLIGVAALWGFAEATLFFIVPDVWLTVLAVTGAGHEVAAIVAIVVGALVGGALMRGWAMHAPLRARLAVAAVPGIGPARVAAVEDDVRRRGLGVLLLGPLRGMPFKIYAIAAGTTRQPILPFLVASVIARLPRLILLAGVACALARWPLGGLAVPTRIVVIGLVWLAFYIWYLRAMSLRPRR